LALQLTEVVAPDLVEPKEVEMFEHRLAHEREVTAQI